MNYSQSVEALFQPIELGHLKLSNRIVMAPMTRQFSPTVSRVRMLRAITAVEQRTQWDLL